MSYRLFVYLIISVDYKLKERNFKNKIFKDGLIIKF